MKTLKNTQKQVLYILKSINNIDILYKVGCCYKNNLKQRLCYWNKIHKKKYGITFIIFKVINVKNKYKSENDLLWYLRDKHKGIPGEYELFFNCENEILNYLSDKYE